jgi:hypothetical protein
MSGALWNWRLLNPVTSFKQVFIMKNGILLFCDIALVHCYREDEKLYRPQPMHFSLERSVLFFSALVITHMEFYMFFIGVKFGLSP